MKRKNAFTLVELLAVIVILAIILVIAVPKIMSVITDSKKASLETSAKVIASTAEKVKLQNQLLGKTGKIECSDVAKLSDSDYAYCNITFDSNNNAIVNITGKGKFDGLYICNADKNNADVSTESCSANASLYSYIAAEDSFIYSAEVVDVNKCTTHLNSLYAGNEENNSALCNGTYDGYTIYDFMNDGNMDIKDANKAGISIIYKKLGDVQINAEKCTNYLNSKYTNNEDSALCNGTYDGYTIKDAIKDGTIPKEDYETAGLTVTLANGELIITDYDVSGGTDVKIPSTLNGNTVVEISELAFYNKGLTSVEIPNTVSKIGTFSFMDNNISSVKFPSNNITISDTTFYNNISITYPSNITVQTTNNNFAKNSWSSISSSDKSTYNIGDRKPVSVGEYGNHIVRVANKTECTTEESETACGFVVEFEDIITLHNMNPSGTYNGTQYDYGWNKDGFPASSMYKFLNTESNGIYNSLPTELKNAIIGTKVISSVGLEDKNAGLSKFTTEDVKLYLLSPEEIYEGYSESWDTSIGTSRQLDYYSNLGVSTSSYSGAIKKLNGNANWWWLRAAYSASDYLFCSVYNNGDWSLYGAYNSYGSSPAFRLAM